MTPLFSCRFSLSYSPLVTNSGSISSLHVSLSPLSFSSCSSVLFRLLSLPLPCSFSRCSSVQLGLFSIALSLFISFGFSSLCHLLSHFFSPSRSLYFKIVETSKNLFKQYTDHGYSKKYSSSKKVFTRLFSCFAQFYFTRLKMWVSMRFRAKKPRLPWRMETVSFFICMPVVRMDGRMYDHVTSSQ